MRHADRALRHQSFLTCYYSPYIFITPNSSRKYGEWWVIGVQSLQWLRIDDSESNVQQGFFPLKRMVAVVIFCKDFNAHRPNLSEIGSVRGDVSPGRPVRTHHRRSPRLYAVPKQAEVQNTKIKLSRYQTLAEHTLLTRINRYTKELDVPWCVDAGARRDRKHQQVRDPGSWETAKSENRAEAGECLNSLF